MTLEIQHTPTPTPIDADAGIELTPALDRGVTIDPLLRPAFVGHARALENVDRLLSGDALCVTSGQQPGLFTGPLFTLYKAISAVVLARACSASLGRPVVPVFWVAGDDHDIVGAECLVAARLDGYRAIDSLDRHEYDLPLEPAELAHRLIFQG